MTLKYHGYEDFYLGHQVIQGLQSAQLLNMIMPSADLILYCGDFNTEPNSVPYRLLQNIVPLNDTWTEYTGKSNVGGETYSTHKNSFTKTGKLFDTGNQAKRIDYIMYRSGRSLEAETIRSVHYIIG